MFYIIELFLILLCSCYTAQVEYFARIKSTIPKEKTCNTSLFDSPTDTGLPASISSLVHSNVSFGKIRSYRFLTGVILPLSLRIPKIPVVSHEYGIKYVSFFSLSLKRLLLFPNHFFW